MDKTVKLTPAKKKTESPDKRTMKNNSFPVVANGGSDYVKRKMVQARKKNQIENSSSDLRTILDLLQRETGVDLSHHKMTTIKRRILHRMLQSYGLDLEKAVKTRTKELEHANKELALQNEEKVKRAEELIIANKELVFQNKQKAKRAAELIIANRELVFQNKEKEKRAAENKELAFQNEEKEKRAAELIIVNTQLESFSYVSSHDLQEPLRKIQTFAMRILETERQNLSERGKDYFNRMQIAASGMQKLIEDLLAFSSLTVAERKFENTNLNKIIEEVETELKEVVEGKQATISIEATGFCVVNIIPFQFRQLMHNLMANALKFSNPGHAPHIIIRIRIEKGSKLNKENPALPAVGLLPENKYCHISVSDNGIGFDPKYKDRIFEVFQKLHGKAEYTGTGIGLAIVKKVVQNHNGMITVDSKLNEGATFNIYIPCFLTK